MPDVHGRHSEIIEVARDRCIAVLLDVESYPSWYETFDEVTVCERDAQGRASRLTIVAGAGPLGDLRVDIEYAYELPNAIAGKQTGGDGNIKGLSSRWLLEAVGETSTRATFSLEASAGNWRTKVALKAAGPLVRAGLVDDFPKALKLRLERTGGPV